jgi:hypothetical protein
MDDFLMENLGILRRQRESSSGLLERPRVHRPAIPGKGIKTIFRMAKNDVHQGYPIKTMSF